MRRTTEDALGGAGTASGHARGAIRARKAQRTRERESGGEAAGARAMGAPVGDEGGGRAGAARAGAPDVPRPAFVDGTKQRTSFTCRLDRRTSH